MLVMTTSTGKALHAVNRDGKNSPCNVANTMRRADQWSRQESQVRVHFADAVTCKRCLKALAAELEAAEFEATAMHDVLTAARSTGQPVLTVTPWSVAAARELVHMGLLVDTPEGYMDPLANHHRQHRASTSAGPDLTGALLGALDAAKSPESVGITTEVVTGLDVSERDHRIITTEVTLDALLETGDAKPRRYPFDPAECPGFDPGNVLAGYDGRACVNCGVREPNGYTEHGLVERDPERTADDLPESAAAIALLVQGLPLADTVHLLQTAAAYGSGRTWHGGKPYRVELGAARGTYRVSPKPVDPLADATTEPASDAADANGQRPDGTTVHPEPDRGPELTTEQARTVLVRGGLPEDRAVALMAGAEPTTTLKAETVFRSRRYLVRRRWLTDRWQVAVR